MENTEQNTSSLVQYRGFTYKRYKAGEPVFFNDSKSLIFNEDCDIYSLDLDRPNKERINICYYYVDNFGFTQENGERVIFPSLSKWVFIGVVNTNPQGRPTGPFLYTLDDVDRYMEEYYNYTRGV